MDVVYVYKDYGPRVNEISTTGNNAIFLHTISKHSALLIENMKILRPTTPQHTEHSHQKTLYEEKEGPLKIFSVILQNNNPPVC